MQKSLIILALVFSLPASHAQAYNHTFINETPWNVVFNAYYASALCKDFNNNWIAPKGETNDIIESHSGACCITKVDGHVVSWTDNGRKNTKIEPMEGLGIDFGCQSMTFYFRENKNPKPGQAKFYVSKNKDAKRDFAPPKQKKENSLGEDILEGLTVVKDNID